jgi:hypothetical protein
MFDGPPIPMASLTILSSARMRTTNGDVVDGDAVGDARAAAEDERRPSS